MCLEFEKDFYRLKEIRDEEIEIVKKEIDNINK